MTAPCHDGGSPPPVVVGEQRILLIGNPNVGKSTLFNAMTGARQRVMNAPGTTVELSEGTWRAGGGAVTVTDLPGTYSLIARSPDERVVADAVLAAPDLARDRAAVAVVLLDATALARSLYLLAQVARSGRPVVTAVTMHDVARERGQAPDLDRLAQILGVPVVPLDPRAGVGLDLLAAALPDARRVPGVPGADPDGAGAPLADRLAEAEPLFDWVEGVLTRLDPPPPPHRTRSDAVDRVLLNPWVGLPVFAATMWALFQLGTSVAAPLMDLVDRVVNGPVSAAARALLSWAPAWVEGLVVDGALAGVGTVATFLPLMALMYAALALLEDSGYLARAALLADRLMRSMGLDGRAVLPLIIGFGCNVPALAATRTLPSARQRLLTGLLVPWTTCAARLTVYILLAGVFFPRHAGTVIFAMYAASVVLVVGGGWVLRRTLFRDVAPEPLLLVLPAYQRPRLRAVGASVWSRVSSFATRAGKVIVVTLTVVWALMAVPAGGGGDMAVGDVPVEDSLYGAAAHAVAPVFAPAGFGNWHATAALATGFVAKEVVVGALAQSYAVEEPTDPARAGSLGEAMRASFEESSGGHGGAAAFAFMVFVLAYTPCLATVAEQWRLFGARWTLGSMGAQLTVAWLAAVAVFQAGRLL